MITLQYLGVQGLQKPLGQFLGGSQLGFQLLWSSIWLALHKVLRHTPGMGQKVPAKGFWAVQQPLQALEIA